MMRIFKNSFIALVLLSQVACGTLIYPERQGQTSGRMDPSVLILNGIGLFFFIVPGLVAFAVDFSTGAIYLPADSASSNDQSEKYVRLLPDDGVSLASINRVIQQHASIPDALGHEDLIVRKINDGQLVSLWNEKIPAITALPVNKTLVGWKIPG